jgi:hypothetical protein
LRVSLIDVRDIAWLALAENQDAVVGDVSEKSRELFLNLALSFFEDFLFSVLELCDNHAE